MILEAPVDAVGSEMICTTTSEGHEGCGKLEAGVSVEGLVVVTNTSEYPATAWHTPSLVSRAPPFFYFYVPHFNRNQ